MNDDEEGNPLGSGFGSILKLTQVNVPTRALVMGEALVSGIMSSLTLGFFCGGLGSAAFPAVCGPLAPFLIGSSVGYGLGLLEYWKKTKATTLWYAQKYPKILAHAIVSDRMITVPPSVVKTSHEHAREQREAMENGSDATVEAPSVTLEQWISLGGLSRLTWCMLAAQRCRTPIATILKHEQKQVVEELIGEDSDE